MVYLPLENSDYELIKVANAILQKRYRKGRHKSAAAVLCESQQIYTGINFEACGYAPCSEMVAIGTAFTNGDWNIKTIVAVSRKGVLSPCGNCRQVFLDYIPNAMIIFNENGKIFKTEARNLLPGSYNTDFENL